MPVHADTWNGAGVQEARAPPVLRRNHRPGQTVMKISRPIAMASGFVAVATVGVAASFSSGPTDDFRVFSVQPACFEYLFTSVVTKDSEGPLLSFNRLHGQTLFARVGERLGQYRIAGFQPVRKEVFNPTINANEVREVNRVALHDSSGNEIILQQGEPHPSDGWLALLTEIKTGEWRYALPGDTVAMNQVQFKVCDVSPGKVTVSSPGGTNILSVITDPEREELTALWKANQASAKSTQGIPSPPAEAATEARRPLPEARAPAAVRTMRTRMSVGTEFRYPSEFEVIPVVSRDANGRITTRALVVPRRFTTRSTGMTVFQTH